MDKTVNTVRAFIERFAELSAGGSPEEVAALFGETFLAAGAQGASCVKREDFARMLPQRKELFARMGWKKTELVTVEEAMLDARFALAKTQWRFQFEQSGGCMEDVLVASTFVVDCGAEPWRIVLYLAHQDIFATLRERGMAIG